MKSLCSDNNKGKEWKCISSRVVTVAVIPYRMLLLNLYFSRHKKFMLKDNTSPSSYFKVIPINVSLWEFFNGSIRFNVTRILCPEFLSLIYLTDWVTGEGVAQKRECNILEHFSVHPRSSSSSCCVHYIPDRFMLLYDDRVRS